jgi:hypothetical protein
VRVRLGWAQHGQGRDLYRPARRLSEGGGGASQVRIRAGTVLKEGRGTLRVIVRPVIVCICKGSRTSLWVSL